MTLEERRQYMREYMRAYRLTDPEKFRVIGTAQSRKWRKANPERDKEYSRRSTWKKRNPRRAREIHKACLLRNPHIVLANRIRDRVNRVLRGERKSDRTFNLVGCSPMFLKQWLEARFKPGMAWANRSLWHVDHIRPCASFDLSDPAQQRACFHYTNLQPLWAEENRAKGSKVLFQTN